MPELEVVRVEIPPALDRLGPVAVWEELERAMPEAFQPLLDLIAARAPIGPTGKLASSGFGLKMRRRAQGLIHGLDVAVGSPEGHAHLVAEGHEIVPRGGGLGGRKKREERAALRADLKRRRAAGAAGFVPGNPFVESSVLQMRDAVVARLEQQLRVAFGGP